MKRILTLLLVLALTLSLCACGGSKEKSTETQAGKSDAQANEPDAAPETVEGLQIGYAKINITPSYSVGLRGYSNAESRMSEGFITYIFATCIAATHGDETILVYTVDTIAMEHSTAESYRALITEATGIPGEKIFIGATHSHSCPDPKGQYKKEMEQWMVEAAQKALADRAPASVLAGTHDIPGMNFVRHYEMADGTYAGSSFGDFSKEIVGHASETDPQMVMVKFDYADESRKDILMINWQAHPDSAKELGYNSIAASWIGPLRDELEKLSGMNVAYFTGASGNQTMDSKIESEMKNMIWSEYGTEMGRIAYEALGCLQPVADTGIRTSRQMLTVEVDHSWDHMLEQANEVYALWKSAGKSAGDALGKKYGFTSSYQARAIRTRASMDETTELEINTFAIGDVGFTTGTYEMFSNHGLYVKRNSPFDITFIITGCSGYIPNPEAYVYRSYEADTGYFASGTGEKLAEAYIEMLNEIK